MASQGDKRIITTTDEQGKFSFPDLSSGDWTIDAEMVGFGKMVQQITVGPNAADAAWTLKLLTQEELVASSSRPLRQARW
jgi:uncharacterized GH25 family protein